MSVTVRAHDSQNLAWPRGTSATPSMGAIIQTSQHLGCGSVSFSGISGCMVRLQQLQCRSTEQKSSGSAAYRRLRTSCHRQQWAVVTAGVCAPTAWLTVRWNWNLLSVASPGSEGRGRQELGVWS